MAKIIVTGINGVKYLVDSNSKFETTKRSPNTILVTTSGGPERLYLQPIEESMEEIQKLINEAEAETTNKKLDLILANQEKLLKALRIR